MPDIRNRGQRLRSLEKDTDTLPYPLSARLVLLKDPTFLDKALQTIVGLRDPTKVTHTRSVTKREVAPFQLMKRKIASDLKKQPL